MKNFGGMPNWGDKQGYTQKFDEDSLDSAWIKCLRRILSGKLLLEKLLICIYPCCCHPELACRGGAERRLVEGSVPLREPQCDSAFNYYGYFFLLLFIRMIFNKFSLKCHEYEKFWGYANSIFVILDSKFQHQINNSHVAPSSRG